MSSSSAEAPAASPVKFSVDREKNTPFLIRVFVHNGPHFTDDAFRDPSDLPSKGQVHIHTWLDATLLEITKLLGKVVTDVQPGYDASVSFALVYPDRKGKMVVKQSGRVSTGSESDDAQKTLKELKFEIGDFLDVSIQTARQESNPFMDRRYRNEPRSPYSGGRGRGYRGRGRGGYRGRGRGRGYRPRGRGRGGFDRRDDRRSYGTSRRYD